MDKCWIVQAVVAGQGRPTFVLNGDAQGIVSDRAAVKVALDVLGLRRMTDCDGIWLDDSVIGQPEPVVSIAVMSPTGILTSWSSLTGEVA